MRGQSTIKNTRRLSNAPAMNPKFTKNVKSLSFSKEEHCAKKFRILGGYPMIQKALESRGWTSIGSESEASADLIFTTLIKNINHKELRQNQIANHFSGITNYCTKSGLSKTLDESVWVGIDASEFSPMTFVIPEECSFEHFSKYFTYFEVG